MHLRGEQAISQQVDLLYSGVRKSYLEGLSHIELHNSYAL
jgi:hypothetical protein